MGLLVRIVPIAHTLIQLPPNLELEDSQTWVFKFEVSWISEYFCTSFLDLHRGAPTALLRQPRMSYLHNERESRRPCRTRNSTPLECNVLVTIGLLLLPSPWTSGGTPLVLCRGTPSVTYSHYTTRTGTQSSTRV